MGAFVGMIDACLKVGVGLLPGGGGIANGWGVRWAWAGAEGAWCRVTPGSGRLTLGLWVQLVRVHICTCSRYQALFPFPQESLGTRLVECITYPPFESTRQPQQLMSLTTDHRVGSIWLGIPSHSNRSSLPSSLFIKQVIGAIRMYRDSFTFLSCKFLAVSRISTSFQSISWPSCHACSATPTS